VRTASRFCVVQPDRIRMMYDHMDRCNMLERCTPVDAHVASEEDLALAHSQEHIERMLSLERALTPPRMSWLDV